MIQNGQLLNYVNGRWQHSRAGTSAEVRNPATAEMLVRVPLSSRDEIDEAVRKESFFGDMHAQGPNAIEFYTQKKVVVERWPKEWSHTF